MIKPKKYVTTLDVVSSQGTTMKTKWIRAAFSAAVLVLLGSAGTANAAFMQHYSEASGDLNNFNQPLETLVLGFGDNTISGGAGRAGDAATPDYDDILISLPADLTITAFSISWTPLISQFTDTFTVDFSVGMANETVTLKSGGMLAAPTTADLFSLAAGFTPGFTSLLDMHSFVITAGAGGLFDYTITITTVPLPPAVWLLASGLLGFAALRRRRHTV